MATEKNTTEQAFQNPFESGELIKGLSAANVSLPKYGTVYRVTCEMLEKQIEELFQKRLGFPELDRVFICPQNIDRERSKCDMHAFFFFNTSVKNSSITRNGDPGKTGATTILDYVPNKGINGEFSVTEKFTKMMSSIAVLDGDKIPIKAMTDKRVACVEIDFMLLIALVLDVDEDKPYNFTIMTVDAGNRRDSDDTENAVLSIMKYIDNNRRYSRTRGNSQDIDYRSMERSLARGISSRNSDRY